MSHFGRSGPQDIKDTFSFLVLNITFRESPSIYSYPTFSWIFACCFFAFRYYCRRSLPYVRQVREGRGHFHPHGLKKKGRVMEAFPKTRDGSRSCSPRPRYRDDYRGNNSRRRNESPHGRHVHERYNDSEREYRRRSRSRGMSPDNHRDRHGKADYDNDRMRDRSHSFDSASPARRRSFTPKRRSSSPANGISPLARRSPSPKVMNNLLGLVVITSPWSCIFTDSST